MKNLNIILLIISSILLSLCISSTYALSPNFVRQHIIDGEDTILIESDLFKNKTFATNLEDCEIWDPLTEKKLTPYGDITEVSYLSDGKFLNSTLWINDYINLANPLYPEGIDIARYPNIKESLAMFMDNFIKNQIYHMKHNGTILTDDYNKSNNEKLPFGNETALQSEITTTRNDPSKTEEKFLMIFVKHKSDIYQFSFSSLSHRYEDLLDEIENVTKSFNFINTNQSSSLQKRGELYENNTMGISFEYPPNSKIIDKPWGITIQFPINKFQLISKSYGMLIDVESIYDNGIDYIKRIWLDRLTNTWNETIYETKTWNETKRLSERFEMMEGNCKNDRR